MLRRGMGRLFFGPFRWQGESGGEGLGQLRLVSIGFLLYTEEILSGILGEIGCGRHVPVAGKGTFQVRLLGQMGNVYIDAPDRPPRVGYLPSFISKVATVPGFSSLQTRGRRGPTGYNTQP